MSCRIILYDNHVLALFLLECMLPLCFCLWFLPVLMLSVYTWGYLWPAYIRRSGVPVPAGSGRHRLVSEPRFWHPQYNQLAD